MDVVYRTDFLIIATVDGRSFNQVSAKFRIRKPYVIGVVHCGVSSHLV
jgi:hypothetical protein